MKGKVCQWKDEQGFGFIKPENGGEKLFFHISSVKITARRPEVGDNVLYDPTRDSQNRLKAKGVVLEGVTKASRTLAKSRHSKVEPSRKNAFDYVSILVILGSFFALGFSFFRTNSIESSWFFGVPAVVGFFILNRQRKPLEKNFTCARCKAISPFDPRTVQAWNNGFHKLYCSSCHRQWLTNNSRQERTQIRSSAGCLGTFAVMMLLPALGGAAIYQWLV